MTYRAYPAYTYMPRCSCGGCLIEVEEPTTGDYEMVSSGDETTMIFVEAEISVENGCEKVGSVDAHTRGKKVLELDQTTIAED